MQHRAGILTLGVLVLSVFALTASAYAAQTDDSSVLHRVRGKISAIDHDKLVLDQGMMQANAKTEFNVGRQTDILKKEPLQLSDLKVGSNVMVTYEQQSDGKQVAKAIIVDDKDLTIQGQAREERKD